MTHPTPDFRVVTNERGVEIVHGYWHQSGVFLCQSECDYSDCCREIWISVIGLTTNGTEWAFKNSIVNTITSFVGGEEFKEEFYRTLKDGKEFFREEVIEAMTRCFEKDREYQRETA